MVSPYQTHNNQLGVVYSFVIEMGLCPSYPALKMKCQRQPGLRLKEGRGAGNEMLLSFNNMPRDWQEVFITKYGNPKTEFNPLEDHFTIDVEARMFYEKYRFQDGTSLKPEQITKYTINASALKSIESLRIAREAMRKAKGNAKGNIWESLMNDLAAFNKVLKLQHNTEHTLKPGERLKAKLKEFLKEGYLVLVDGRNKNQSAAKVKEDTHQAVIEELLKKHTNLDNEQVKLLYNHAAEKLGWKPIQASTVANWRAKLGLYTYAGRRGETNFRNNKAMQVKRKAPSVAMAYWTLDGWDVELLFQQVDTNAKGHKVTTFHNRPTVVVVLDRVAGLNYPIGYAIGTHETPELIKQALRNAANHTRELFGARYKTIQLQSDRYGNGALTPIYQAVTEYYTPARARNSKAKSIEPWFRELNKDCQLYFGNNWSGFGVTARKESQPSEDYLNKIRHSFPDYAGVCQQIDRLIQMKRQAVVEEYLQRWEALPESDKLSLTTEEYLYLFGETHSHTKRIEHDGFNPTLLGEKQYFDCFDVRFRELAYVDWAVKYDPSDLSQILVLNAKKESGSGRVSSIEGTHRFMLEAKHIQPEALYDRKDGDATALKRITDYNKNLEDKIIQRNIEQRAKVDELFLTRPELNDTLTKMVLVDSNGQHKDQRNARRLPKPVQELPPATSSGDYEIIEDDTRKDY